MKEITILGIKYILIECPASSSKELEKLEKELKQYGCIYVGFDIIKHGIFYPTVFKVKVLVPEEKIVEIAKEKFL